MNNNINYKISKEDEAFNIKWTGGNAMINYEWLNAVDYIDELIDEHTILEHNLKTIPAEMIENIKSDLKDISFNKLGFVFNKRTKTFIFATEHEHLNNEDILLYPINDELSFVFSFVRYDDRLEIIIDLAFCNTWNI